MLINLRNALMAGKRLPYDAELEYLESTGTQWIDTGVATSYSAKIEVTFLLHQVATQAVFGCRVTSGTGVFFGTSSTGAVFCNNGNSALSPALNLSAETIYSVIQKGNAVTVNGNNYFTSGAANSTASMLLFARREEGSASRIIHGRIYSWRVYDGNGNLVQDAIPVRKGTVGYLYDRVSGKLFGNAGTGDFVLGPDVVPVEYIESHGTEWIDTGFIPGLNFHIDVRGRKAGDYSANAAIFSNEGVNSYVDCYYNAGWAMRCYGNGTARPIHDGWFDAGIDFDFTSSPTTTFHLNSEEATATTSKTEAQITGSTKSVRLFQGMYGKTNPVDIVFFNADKNGQPALRLRAVRVGTGSTWEGAMMDVLTRRIYRNAGTGAFTYGNDLKYPIPSE